MWMRVAERELDRLRWRRLPPDERGIEIEQCGNEFSAIPHRCSLDKPDLEP